MSWLTTKLLGYVSIGLTVLLLAKVSGLQRDLAQAHETNARMQAGIATERETFERKAREAEKEHLAKREAVIEQWHKDKADAKQDSDRIIADLRAGNRKLRTYWEASAATCALVSGVSAAASEPDGQNRLREDSLGRVLHAVGTCQAQRDGLIGFIESITAR